MKVVLTGASGLLGSALVASFRADAHDVVRLVRREPSAPDQARWDPVAGRVDPGVLDGADLVVHLAGVTPGDRPWTPAHARAVMDSRVQGTTVISRAVAAAEVPRLFTASGVGYYGNPGDRVVDESDPPGAGFMAEVARRWEESTAPASEAGARVVPLRTGVVVSAKGGAYGRRLLPIFRLGLGGRLGSGRQWWSWVALEDYVRAVRFLADHDELSGAVNVSAPQPLTNADMTAAMGRVLHRPTVTRAPGFALRLALGDFGKDLLGGQRVVPRRLQDAGFIFALPEFESALREVLAGAHPRATS
ncbi:MAG: TIGR01777 family oxidoreductase [Actinomycetes bacterium]